MIRGRLQKLVAASGFHGALLAAVVLVLGPIVWIASTSFKTQIAILSGAVSFSPTLSNFNELLFSRTSSYFGNFLNSVVVAAVSTAIVMLIATMAAYSLARSRWPRWVSAALLTWALVIHMIPPVVLAGAWFVIFRDIGLINTYLALVLAHATLNLPMALWLMRAFVDEVPVEIEDAAKIDGASVPVIFIRIVVPLVAPGMIASGILAFIFSWNEFPVALALTSPQTATVPLAIAKYAQDLQIKYGEMAAGAMLSLLPAMLALVVGQRFIVRGLTAGALK